MGARFNNRALLKVVVVGLALLCGTTYAAISAELEADLQRAEALQEERPVEPADIVVSSRIISLSPAAQLANGDGDISTVGKCIWNLTRCCQTSLDHFCQQGCVVSAGDCAGDIDTFCSSVKAGRRHLADCLQNQVDVQQAGNTQGKDVSLRRTARDNPAYGPVSMPLTSLM